jgi:hypothetical protein
MLRRRWRVVWGGGGGGWGGGGGGGRGGAAVAAATAAAAALRDEPFSLGEVSASMLRAIRGALGVSVGDVCLPVLI